LDFTATFDVIDHSLLIAKLKAYGFSHSALTWVDSYLSNIGRNRFILMEVYLIA